MTATTDTSTDPSVLDPESREEWRAWLAAKGDAAREVWLVIRRAGNDAPGVRHREAVEEALCFGWIDSLARRQDAGSWRQRFSPRRPASTWSALNRELVAKLRAEGRMAPAGEAAVALARYRGTWDPAPAVSGPGRSPGGGGTGR